MTFTEADLIPLKAAYLSGTTSLRIGERQVNFRTLNELKKIISEVEASIWKADNPTATPVNPNIVRATFSKYSASED